MLLHKFKRDSECGLQLRREFGGLLLEQLSRSVCAEGKASQSTTKDWQLIVIHVALRWWCNKDGFFNDHFILLLLFMMMMAIILLYSVVYFTAFVRVGNNASSSTPITNEDGS